jgi:hypothetical protein
VSKERINARVNRSCSQQQAVLATSYEQNDTIRLSVTGTKLQLQLYIPPPKSYIETNAPLSSQRAPLPPTPLTHSHAFPHHCSTPVALTPHMNAAPHSPRSLAVEQPPSSWHLADRARSIGDAEAGGGQPSTLMQRGACCSTAAWASRSASLAGGGGGGWGEEALLAVAGGAAGCGVAVALSGDRTVVGCAEAVASTNSRTRLQVTPPQLPPPCCTLLAISGRQLQVC